MNVSSLLVLCLGFTCWISPPCHAKDPYAASPLRVLFVGNSYLYVNDLPAAVERVAASRGIAVNAQMLAQPNFAIEDHIRNGSYAQAIALGWDWVVLQQGPSTLPQNQQNLRIWAGRAAREARLTGAKVALMSAWPAVVNATTSIAAEESYRAAAIDARACVFPVATAWRVSRSELPLIELYDADGLHAAKAGTLLAALVIARGLLPGPYQSTAPPLQAHFPAPEWSMAVRESAALDLLANQSDQSEFARCRLDK